MSRLSPFVPDTDGIGCLAVTTTGLLVSQIPLVGWPLHMLWLFAVVVVFSGASNRMTGGPS